LSVDVPVSRPLIIPGHRVFAVPPIVGHGRLVRAFFLLSRIGCTTRDSPAAESPFLPAAAE
jgi:hypothetical protein